MPSVTHRLALAVILSALLASCGGGRPSGRGAFIVHNGAEPQTLDPGLQKGVPEHRVNIALFEGLTVYDAKDLSAKPGVAERWDLNEDGTVYTFHLRPSKWSNGDPLTAHDFEWSWKRVLDPALAGEYAAQVYNYLRNAKAYYDGASADGVLKGWSELAADKKAESARALPDQVHKRHVEGLKKLLAEEQDEKNRSAIARAIEKAPQRDDVTVDMVGVKAKDDRTLLVTLEAPTPYFLDLTAFFTYYPVHRKTVEKHGNNWTQPENLVGNGPYRMKEWRIKDYILVEKSPHYWNAANVVDQQIKFLPIEDTSTAFRLYDKNQIHWLTDVPREYIEEVMKRPDYHSGPFLTTYFYGFNTKRGPTKDKRIRRALGLAIDKRKIVKFITRAGESVANSIVPPGLPGYTPATMPEYNVEKAKKLLAEAGFPDGQGFPRIEILYNTQEGHKKIAAAIQEMWRTSLNIDVELRNVEWKIYLDMQSRLEFDAVRRGWVGDYTDPNTFIDMFMTDNGNNNTGWSNPAYDGLVRDAARERDPARRMKMLHEAEAILMDEMPIVPIYFYVTKNMWRDGVTGLFDNVRDTHPLERVKVSGHAN